MAKSKDLKRYEALERQKKHAIKKLPEFEEKLRVATNAYCLDTSNEELKAEVASLTEKVNRLKWEAESFTYIGQNANDEFLFELPDGSRQIRIVEPNGLIGRVTKKRTPNRNSLWDIFPEEFTPVKGFYRINNLKA
jgi:hypothetical protein